MKYVSTRGRAPASGFSDVLLAGLAGDGGLFVPEAWPRLSPQAIAALAGRPYAEAAFEVIRPFIDGEIGDDALTAMCVSAYATFRHPAVVPLTQIAPGAWVLELFHGPTLAFKDVAMQLLARLMDHVLARQGRRVTIIGATSGDTGAAAIEAFRGRDNADVFILFPEGRVSPIQQRQMTTVAADNIHAIAIQGTFDDCQALVKGLFGNERLRQRLGLAGINSINWARILGQIVYYFTAAVALGSPARPVSFTVPTGNFGDIFAGYAAKRMGLPVEKLVIATNINDILARTLASGRYELNEVAATTSPSMDIQVSSNFERLLFEAYGRDGAAVEGLMQRLAQARAFDIAPGPLEAIRADFAAGRADEAEGAATLSDVHASTGMLPDPHTAIALAVSRRFVDEGVPMVTLATAHPAKFLEAVAAATGVEPAVPDALAGILAKSERYATLANDARVVEDYIAAHSRAISEESSDTMTVRLSRLESGLTVITHPMDELESAALGVFVGAGSRSEEEQEHGLSHLLEHMAFKGTRTRSALEIAEEIEAVGGEVNAATSVETTSYYARILKNDVPLALDILADILQNSAFDPKELAREQHVIVQEIGAALDSPDDRVYDLFTEAAYPAQPIGRTILGTPETVRATGSPMLDAYLGRHYRGPRMVLAGAGALNHDRLVELATERFASLGREPGPSPVPAVYKGGDQRQSRDQMETQIIVGFEGRPYTSEGFYTAQVLSAVLGGGMSSRLFQEVRERRGLCYSIYAFHWSFSDTGMLGVHAAAGPSDVGELMPVILGELERAAHDIGETELQRAKAQLRAGLLMTLENPAARAGQLARQMLLFNRHIPVKELAERIDAITVEEIRQLAEDIITGSRPTLAAVGPLDGMMSAEKVAEHFGARLSA